MKKLIFGMLMTGSLAFAQTYTDYYPTSTSFYEDGLYSEDDDSFYFPDDYYYEYPADYYTEDFYRNSYNDYQQSIHDINWERFFYENRLTNWQIQQIMDLNRMYGSYDAWNHYYRFNPDRWYYDRFFAIRTILGPRLFVIFQNVYYGGYSPFMYYRNYRMRHYSPVVYVMPRYSNVNINRYKVDRIRYHQNNGWYNRPTIGLNGNTRTGAKGTGGFRPMDNTNGGRKSTIDRPQRTENSGFRSEKPQNPTRNQNSVKENRETPRPSSNGGFRNSSSPRSESGVRGGAPSGSSRSSGVAGMRLAQR